MWRFKGCTANKLAEILHNSSNTVFPAEILLHTKKYKYEICTILSPLEYQQTRHISKVVNFNNLQKYIIHEDKASLQKLA